MPVRRPPTTDPRRVRAVAWLKEGRYGAEYAQVTLLPNRLAATGVAVGAEPLPYRLDYRLETRRDWVSARLRVDARGDGWRRTLDLRRAAAGAWTIAAHAEGDAPLPPPGGDPTALAGALDCDLGLSPLTNSMPVLRHALLDGGPPVEFLMAWVSVPDLAVRPMRQRYTHLRTTPDHTLIRYENADGTFTSDLTFDRDGLVRHYPQITRDSA